MRIFLTGASGYIGSAVASALSRAGHVVHGLVRTEDKAKAVAALEVHPVLGTMQEPAKWREVAARCQVLIHCASEYSAQRFDLEKRTSEVLLEIADARPGRLFLYTSGVWVLGNTDPDGADETAPYKAPAMVTQRVAVEQMILAAASRQRRTLVVRPGCVYGGRGGLTGIWFETATKEGAARVVGDGTNRWTMIHIADLAELYVKLAESSFSGEVFHATDRSRSTVRECAAAASRAVGAGGKVALVPLAEATKFYGGMVECLALDQHVDSSKAARWLGWQPRHGGFVDGVERYAAAWR